MKTAWRDALLIGGSSVPGRGAPGPAGSLDALLVVALFAFLPLEHTQAMRHVLAAALALRGLWLLARYRDGSFLGRAWVVAPWLAWASLSYFWSVAPDTTIGNLKHDLWTPLLAMFGCYQIFRHRCPPALLLLAAAAGTATNAFVTLFGSAAAPLPLAWAAYYYSTIGYASTYALYLATLALPWVLGCGIGGGRGRPLAAAVVAANVAVALLLQSRMFFLAGALVLILAAWMARRLGRRTVQALVAAAVVLAGTFVVVNEDRTQAVTAGAGVGGGLAHVLQKEVRFEIWKRWGDLAVSGPALGVGFGRDVPPTTLDPALRSSLLAVDQFAAMHSHNLFLNIVVEVGWPGLACFLFLLGGLSWRFLRARGASDLAACSGLLLLAAVVLKNQTDVFMLFSPAVLFYAALGSLLAWLRDPPSSS